MACHEKEPSYPDPCCQAHAVMQRYPSSSDDIISSWHLAAQKRQHGNQEHGSQGITRGDRQRSQPCFTVMLGPGDCEDFTEVFEVFEVMLGLAGQPFSMATWLPYSRCIPQPTHLDGHRIRTPQWENRQPPQWDNRIYGFICIMIGFTFFSNVF